MPRESEVLSAGCGRCGLPERSAPAPWPSGPQVGGAARPRGLKLRGLGRCSTQNAGSFSPGHARARRSPSASSGWGRTSRKGAPRLSPCKAFPWFGTTSQVHLAGMHFNISLREHYIGSETR